MAVRMSWLAQTVGSMHHTIRYLYTSQYDTLRGWTTLGILIQDILHPRILTWLYQVILTLGNSGIEFCNTHGHGSWEMPRILTYNHDQSVSVSESTGSPHPSPLEFHIDWCITEVLLHNTSNVLQLFSLLYYSTLQMTHVILNGIQQSFKINH